MSNSFSYKITNDSEQFTFDYTPVMGSGEFILSPTTTPTGQPTCTAVVKEGTDSNPSAILVGSPVVSGFKVAQRISGGIDGVTYSIQMTATTNLGNIYTVVGDLPVLAPINV
jgi:hypothetical protein